MSFFLQNEFIRILHTTLMEYGHSNITNIDSVSFGDYERAVVQTWVSHRSSSMMEIEYTRCSLAIHCMLLASNNGYIARRLIDCIHSPAWSTYV